MQAHCATDVHAHYVSARVKTALESASHTPTLAMLTDLERRRDWMRERSLGWQVLGPEMRYARYDVPGSEGADWARRLNDATAEDLDGPSGFVALATVPLQDGARAARELEHAITDLGVRGAMIHSRPASGLHRPSLDPFWAIASELSVPVVVHSAQPFADERLARYDLGAAVGKPSRPWK